MAAAPLSNPSPDTVSQEPANVLKNSTGTGAFNYVHRADEYSPTRAEDTPRIGRAGVAVARQSDVSKRAADPLRDQVGGRQAAQQISQSAGGGPRQQPQHVSPLLQAGTRLPVFTWVHQWRYLGLLPTTMSKYIRCNSLVMGPGWPSAMGRQSNSTTGVRWAAVPLRNTSSARYNSLRSMVRISMSRPNSAPASCITVSRVYAAQGVVLQAGGVDAAVLDHEQIFAGTFGHVAVVVQQDGLVKAAEGGLGLGEDAVDVDAARLDAGRNHRVVNAPPRGRAAAQPVAAQVVAEGNGNQREVRRQVLQLQVGDQFLALVGQRADVNVAGVSVALNQPGW